MRGNIVKKKNRWTELRKEGEEAKVVKEHVDKEQTKGQGEGKEQVEDPEQEMQEGGEEEAEEVEEGDPLWFLFFRLFLTAFVF